MGVGVLAEHTPQHQRQGHADRGDHEHVVGRLGTELPVRVVAHALIQPAGCPESGDADEYGDSVPARRPRRVLAAACVAMLAGAPGGRAVAAPPPDTEVPEEGGSTDDAGPLPTAPAGSLPLIPVPEGCEPAPQAYVVFVGTVVDRDFRTIRFEVEQIRDGRTAPFAGPAPAAGGGELLDVRYGLDAQYLTDGERYLVGAVVDSDLGVLVSRIEPDVENFGGDEVIGVSETDVDCRAFADPAITVHPDGRPVDGPMLQAFFDAKWRIVAAIALPFGLACAALFGLSAVRLSLNGLLRGIFRPRRA